MRPFCYRGIAVANQPANANPSGAHVIDLPVRAGQVLEGKFRIERIIGEGAMGLVVEATHLALDQRVALKFLRAAARARPDIVSRFAREARAAAKINSDHVARVFDVGGTDDGTPFIVMEYLEGRDLEQILVAHGCLEISEAAEYIIQACEGVVTAHARGIVHRDIKPANLFITERASAKQVKLVDFGISKAGITDKEVDVASANTTQIMGSPHYMSPEQIRSTKDVDHRADIWSLGVVLFELLTGQTPFTATEVTGIIAQVLHEPHRQARAVRPELPAPLERIIDKCLAKDASQRYQSAADLAEALVPFAPKRSRAVAEKAAAIARAAGAPVQVPIDSLAPPAPSGLRPMGVQSGDTLQLGEITIPRAAPVPSGAGVPVAAQSSPSLGAPMMIASQTPPPRGGATVYVALVAIIIGCLGGIFALVTRFGSSPPAPTVVVVPSGAPATPAATVTTANSAPASADSVAADTPSANSANGETSARPVGAGAGAVIPAQTVATPPRPGPVNPVNPAIGRPVAAQPARPTTSPPVVTRPPSTESDIRHER